MSSMDIGADAKEGFGAAADVESGTDTSGESEVESGVANDLARDFMVNSDSDREAGPGSLQTLLERISLVAGADQIPDDDIGMVTLTTLHTVRGLEFPVVFLVSWGGGPFPHLRTPGDSKELAEERCLAYVGITRARKQLYPMRVVTRSSWGSPQNNPPPRFLGEVPSDLIGWLRKTPARSWGTGSGGFGFSGYSTDNAFGHGHGTSSGFDSSSSFGSGRSTSPGMSSRKKDQVLYLESGSRVVHGKYNLDTVSKVQEVTPQVIAMTDFGSADGARMMLIDGVPMEKLQEATTAWRLLRPLHGYPAVDDGILHFGAAYIGQHDVNEKIHSTSLWCGGGEVRQPNFGHSRRPTNGNALVARRRTLWYLAVRYWHAGLTEHAHREFNEVICSNHMHRLNVTTCASPSGHTRYCQSGFRYLQLEADHVETWRRQCGG